MKRPLARSYRLQAHATKVWELVATPNRWPGVIKYLDRMAVVRERPLADGCVERVVRLEVNYKELIQWDGLVHLQCDPSGLVISLRQTDNPFAQADAQLRFFPATSDQPDTVTISGSYRPMNLIIEMMLASKLDSGLRKLVEQFDAGAMSPGA
jgi:ribosome-associated toxin RatA of RatAB toxin-antitoxin module